MPDSIEDYAEISVSYIGEIDLSLPDGVVLVEDDCGYVRACQKLPTPARQAGVRGVWVRRENHFTWLRDFVEQIDYPAVFSRKTAKDILADRWKANIPEWLDDDEVIQQGLLDVYIEDTSPDSLVNKVLVHFLGQEFNSSKLQASNIGKILSSLVQERVQKYFEQYPILKRCLEEKTEEWAFATQEEWTRQMSWLLGSDPQTAWKYASFCKLLAGYPDQLLEYVVPANDVGWVRELPQNALTEISLEPTAKEQALTQIEFYFQQVKEYVQTNDEFKKVVNSLSGQVRQELIWLKESILQKNVADLEDIQNIEEKFKECPGVNRAELRALRHLIKPEKPRNPEEDRNWEADDWISWSLHEYLPFRIWQEHAFIYDESVENAVCQFSDWYVREYSTIHQSRDLSLVNTLDQIMQSSQGTLSLVLLIDCFCTQYLSHLDDSFQNFGLSRHGLAYRLAPLPTTTKNNKPLLLSGQWNTPDTNYENILKERKNADWNGREVHYVSSLQELSDLKISGNGCVVVLNFVETDKLLHENLEALKTNHDEELFRIFHRIAQTTYEVTEQWLGDKSDIEIIVCSDHGACKVLDEEKRSFDSQIVNKLFPDEQHRFCSVDKKKAADIPENVWEIGYQFDDPFEKSEKVHFIPRGHNTVRSPIKGKAYLHGGATPEEVIVPHMVYKPVKISWIPLAIRFINLDFTKDAKKPSFYVQRVVQIQIEIQNSNSVQALVKRSSVITPETDLKKSTKPVIQPGKTNVLELDCYFQKSAIDNDRLELEITYELAGEEHTLHESIACEFRSAMKPGLNLKDLF